MLMGLQAQRYDTGTQCDGGYRVSYLVPNRFEDGYGLSPAIVDAATSFAPQVLVTVDNGISSLDGVAYARERGIRVIVTDHHLPGAALPTADAIVNPNVPGDAFPSKNLAGVGVAFYLLAALRAHLSKAGWFERVVECTENGPVAGLGSVRYGG